MKKAEGTSDALVQAMMRFGKIHILFRDEGVTKGEYFALATLHDHAQRRPTAKGMYVSELAELMEVKPPAVSRMLRGMEGKGYLERVVDRENRRTTYIVLGPKGEALWLKTRRQAEEFLRRVAGRMGEEELAAFVVQLNRFVDIMNEEQAKGF